MAVAVKAATAAAAATVAAAGVRANRCGRFLLPHWLQGGLPRRAWTADHTSHAAQPLLMLLATAGSFSETYINLQASTIAAS